MPATTLHAYSTLRLEAEDGIATLTLDRADRMNAFTFAMAREWLDALERIDADDAIRAVIVTGAGKAFCAGADLSGGGGTFDPNEGEMQDASATPAAPRDIGGMIALRLYRCRKPILAAVNGAAVGVGVADQDQELGLANLSFFNHKRIADHFNDPIFRLIEFKFNR